MRSRIGNDAVVEEEDSHSLDSSANFNKGFVEQQNKKIQDEIYRET